MWQRLRRRSLARRAWLRGAAMRTGFFLLERAGRIAPRRFPMVNRMNGRLELVDVETFGRYASVAYGVGMVRSFGNVGLVTGRHGALLIDTATPWFAQQAWLTVRAQTELPVRQIILTHGHIDHVGGLQIVLDAIREAGQPRPEIWAHERVLARLDRYERLYGWTAEVNRQQFSLGSSKNHVLEHYVRPDRVYSAEATIDFEGEPVRLFHAEAETDDATWVWLPERRTAFVGDLLIHSLPNTGNPNKVQRHTLGWAVALEAVAAQNPEHVIPGHGPPVSGDLAREMLCETARALRFVHDAVVERLNAGVPPHQIIADGVRLPADLASKPYLEERYGCVEFIVRDVLREYGGWWDGNPAHLFPPSRSDIGRDLMDLVPAEACRQRIQELLQQGAPRRALQLAVPWFDADPQDPTRRDLLVEVLNSAADREPSFIARNLFAQAALRVQNGEHPRTGGAAAPIAPDATTTVSVTPASATRTVSQSSVSFAKPYRSPLMRAFNALGNAGRAIGLQRRLNVDGILRLARRRAGGADDFGDDLFVEGLSRLVDDFERSARLTPLGRLLTRERLVTHATNRYRQQAAFSQNAALSQETIRRPMFVIGLPRTGTTLLQNLLCQDPQCRPLMYWETFWPGPDPLCFGGTSDPRRRKARFMHRASQRIMPQLQAIHPMDPDGPEECTWLLGNTFASPGFTLDGYVPEYLDWVFRRPFNDLVRAYADYRRQLQWIQHGGPSGRHWVNKSPLHLFAMDAMLNVFPDGCFIQTHRDPHKLIASTCSLMAVLRGRSSDAIDPAALGREVAQTLSTMLQRSEAARANSGNRIFDVQFTELMSDPVGTVRRIYDHFEYEFPADMERRMQTWLRENPANKHGVHKYDLSQFQLQPERIDELFGEYAARFGIAREGSHR